MLNRSRIGYGNAIYAQRGVVLMISLIMLVSLTLAGIGLMRSVDTTNIIAGNLAFKQSATNSGDLGTESAVAWLENNSVGNTLNVSNATAGYSSQVVANLVAGQSWDSYWTDELVPAGIFTLPDGDAFNATGNRVAYSIQRLCNTSGASVGAGCAIPQTVGNTSGNSRGAGVIALLFNSQVYYRITTRVVGPRNTVSYIQSVISL